MKKCVNCSTELMDDASFCTECGAAQPNATMEHEVQVVKSQTPGYAKLITNTVHDVTGSMEMMSKIGYFGAFAVIASAFLPLVSLMGIVSISLSDVSKWSLAVIVLTGVLGIYSVLQKKYLVLPNLGTGLILIAIVGAYEYQLKMGELVKSVGDAGALVGALAEHVIKVDWGIYLFVIGSLAVCVAGLALQGLAEGRIISASVLVEKYKAALLYRISLGGAVIPGWILAVIVAVAFIIVTMETYSLKDIMDPKFMNALKHIR